tara:strand:+ start:3021 stop:3548 length:528 start_codon:yes stop_codon:yes gene_type:complete
MAQPIHAPNQETAGADDGEVEKRVDQLRQHLQPLKEDPGSVMEAIYAAQEIFGFVTSRAIEVIAEELGYPEAHVYGVVTFYTMFYTDDQPPYILRVCRDLSCHLAGAEAVAGAIERKLNVHPGETSQDGLFKLELVSCLGQCEKQPAMLVNLDAKAEMTAEKAVGLIDELKAERE